MEELKRKAELLLEQCESVVLTSIDENGFPRPVPMSKVKTEGITTSSKMVMSCTSVLTYKNTSDRITMRSFCIYKRKKQCRIN